MGRKNKIKTTRRAAASPVVVTNKINNDNALEGDDLAFLKKDQRGQFINGASYNEPPLFPSKPNMNLDPWGMRQTLLALPPNKRSPLRSGWYRRTK